MITVASATGFWDAVAATDRPSERASERPLKPCIIHFRFTERLVATIRHLGLGELPLVRARREVRTSDLSSRESKQTRERRQRERRIKKDTREREKGGGGRKRGEERLLQERCNDELCNL